MNYRKFLKKRENVRVAAVVLGLFTLAACNLNQQVNQTESIGFREARFSEITAMREFRSCRDEALKLDTQARATGALGQYLASAKLLEKCEANLGPNAAGQAIEERMRAYGTSIQNYIKGGSPERAAANLENFQKAFPNKDLYLTGDVSFIETMQVLLGQRETTEYGQFSALNISGSLKSEMRRVRYWKQN
jgi:hypothetical protein